MSARSEYYQAVADEGHDAHIGSHSLSSEAIAGASLFLCLGVFFGALVVAWRKSSESLARCAALPFDQQPTTEKTP